MQPHSSHSTYCIRSTRRRNGAVLHAVEQVQIHFAWAGVRGAPGLFGKPRAPLRELEWVILMHEVGEI